MKQVSIIFLGIDHYQVGPDTVHFSIHGKKYSYTIDGALANRIEDIARYKPGKALNVAKKNGVLVEE
jgi:hypothetical protein